MFILKIILIVLAVIVLLLSIPVYIKVSYDFLKPSKKVVPPPDDEPVEYVPDSDDYDTLYVVSYLKDNGLWPKPPPAKSKKVLTVAISYLFFKFTVFPMKIKTKKTKPEVEKTKKNKEDAQEKTSSKLTFDDVINLLKEMQTPIAKFISSVLNNIKFQQVEIKAVVSGEDSATTASNFLKLNQTIYLALPILLNYVSIRFSKIQIKPDFFAEQNDFSAKFNLRFNPIVLLFAVLKLAVRFLFKIKNPNLFSKKDVT